MSDPRPWAWCVHRSAIMRSLRRLCALSILLAACGTSDGSEQAESVDRGPLGKADLSGSCEAPDGDDFCGGQSNGSCWCDELCEGFGDCCDDVQEVCEPDACEPVLCELFCEHGFATDDEGCEVCECNPPPPPFCGGFAGLPCPDGLECVDDPDDDCDPMNGGADCGGICLPPAPQFCGGIAALPCPEGLECVDDPDDGCDPMNGGADCGGICVEPSGCSVAECGPGPLAPNVECDDGTIGGPACVEQDGECGWIIVECPEPSGPSCEDACGGSADGCWCDELCAEFGDCCDDYAAACGGGEPNCGDLSCGGDEVCVTHVTQLGLQFSCAPISEDCDGEATCGCMGEDVCTGAFNLCNDGDDGLSCGCPVC